MQLGKRNGAKDQVVKWLGQKKKKKKKEPGKNLGENTTEK